MKMKYFNVLAAVFAVCSLTLPALAQEADRETAGEMQREDSDAEQQAIQVELNKAEQVERGCQYFLLLRNRTELDLATFRLDMYFFDTDGVIAKRLLVDTPALGPGDTRVAGFLAPELQCDTVSQILVNDVQPCETVEGDAPECYEMLDLGNRTEARFFK
jgi:hypothetical protein